MKIENKSRAYQEYYFYYILYFINVYAFVLLSILFYFDLLNLFAI